METSAYLSENYVQHHFGEGMRTMMLSLIERLRLTSQAVKHLHHSPHHSPLYSVSLIRL